MKKMNTTTANESTQAATAKNATPSKKRKSIHPLWRVLDKARTIFDAQLEKSNAVKLRCVQKVFEGVSDVEKLWGQFMAEANRLFDSRRYCAECTALGVSPENLAEHIALLGAATINKVLANGIIATIGTDYKLYVDRFTRPEDVDLYLPAYYDGPRQRIVPTTEAA